MQITRFSYLLHASWPRGKQMVEKSKIHLCSFRLAPIYCPQNIPRQTEPNFIIPGEFQKIMKFLVFMNSCIITELSCTHELNCLTRAYIRRNYNIYQNSVGSLS